MHPTAYFDRGVRLRPNAVAFAMGDETVTYAEASAATHRVAHALSAAGAGPGVKVAVLSPNCIAAMLVVLGVLRCGATWVPINIRNGDDENREVIRLTDCQILIAHSDFTHMSVPVAVRKSLNGMLAGRGEGLPFPALSCDPDRISAILSTGGTTGRPKGVMWRDLTWECLVASFWAHLPCEEQPVYLLAAPMTHAAGVIGFPLMAAGARIVILEKAEPLAVMQAIERERVTHLFLPPTVIYLMLAHPLVRSFDYSSLRYFIYSAAPMAAPKIAEAIDVFGPVMAQAYGQAEVPLMGTYLSPVEHRTIMATNNAKRLRSCGRPGMFVELEIQDEDGRSARTGEPGEIVFRGNLVMAGYYNDPGATAAASRAGWHRTGDIGYLDEEGYVYIVDRQKDMIITGGFNVYSAEIEQHILAHPAVQDCAVIGVPHDVWGEAVKAVVELKAGHDLEPDELIARCRSALGGVKTPKTVEIWPSLPRSPVGKVLKRAVRA